MGLSGSRHLVGGGGINRGGNGRRVSEAVAPRVGDVLVEPAIKVSIQRDRSAGAHVHLGSADLQIATELINCELSHGKATAFHRGGHSINTGDGGGQLVTRNTCNCGIRTCPCIGSTRDISSRQLSRVVLADHVVTRNGERQRVKYMYGIGF